MSPSCKTQAGEQKWGGEHPIAFVARNWLTSLFRVLGLVPTFPPPPRTVPPYKEQVALVVTVPATAGHKQLKPLGTQLPHTAHWRGDIHSPSHAAHVVPLPQGARAGLPAPTMLGKCLQDGRPCHPLTVHCLGKAEHSESQG